MVRSKSSSSRAEVRLRIDASSPMAEVFLIDHQLRLVERGVGRLETKQLPGIYKIKVRLGSETAEELVELDKDRTIHVSPPPMASPTLLWGTSLTHEYQIGAAERESREIHFRAGTGASIFVFARYWTQSALTQGRRKDPPNPISGLSLGRLDGKMVLQFDKVAKFEPVRDAWAGCTVSVDPGPYVLRSRTREGGTVEQIVCACHGWQTQIFLLRTDGTKRGTQRILPSTANLNNLSVLMGRDGFDATREDMALAEAARMALAQERPIFTDELSRLLLEKFENPMLGLFGAHLMLLSKDRFQGEKESGGMEAPRAFDPMRFDQKHFQTVVRNVVSLIGEDHPDVRALLLKCSPGVMSEPSAFTFPPMLWRSWSLIVEASNNYPSIVPIKTWKRIFRTTNTRPFLSWLKGPRMRNKDQDKEIMSTLAPWKPPREVQPEFVSAPLMYLSPMAMSSEKQPTFPASSGSGLPQLQDQSEQRRQISVDLGIPRSAIDWAFDPA